MNASKAFKKANKNLIRNQKSMVKKAIRKAIGEGNLTVSIMNMDNMSSVVKNYLIEKGYRVSQFKACVIVSWRN